MALMVADGNANFIFGLGGNTVLTRHDEGLMIAFRVVLKAEFLPDNNVASDKDNERFMVTSMRGP